jgi:hypothetical protein
MLFIYRFFVEYRLYKAYSDIKFCRVSKIKYFSKIRDYKSYSKYLFLIFILNTYSKYLF